VRRDHARRVVGWRARAGPTSSAPRRPTCSTRLAPSSGSAAFLSCSHAFAVLGNMLGGQVAGPMVRTEDVDMAHDHRNRCRACP